MTGLLAFTWSQIGPNDYLTLLAGLLAWVLIYMVYKIAWHPDYGVPIRRRILCSRLRVDRDQIAFVPFWWNDIQIQRAIKSHWKQSLRQSFNAPSPQGR